MKRSFFLLAGLLALLAACTPKIPDDAYVIGFYNVENLFDTTHDRGKNDQAFTPDGENRWTPDKYEKKLSNIASVIRAMSQTNGRWHTILGLAEVENEHVLQDLVACDEIAEAGYKFVHFESPDVRGIDCALLYRPGQFEVQESRTIGYDFNTHSGIVFEKTPQEQAEFLTRDVLFVRGWLGGEMFGIYVAHYPSRIGGKGMDLRSRASEIIYDDIREQEQRHPGIKIVVMGDMNDNPEDESLLTWLHSRETIAQMQGGDLFSPFLRMHKDGFGSEEYHGEWNIFDCIFVNGALANPSDGSLRIQKSDDVHYGYIFNPPFLVQQDGPYAGTPFRTFSGGQFIEGYSDHYPTYIIVSKQ
ncbi:MAG: endonuclease/exonuclease/phosphatase family protein [Bacteroidales bacterium]|nr:endonuclease/exonuclease/phosphatase family protein [Bacteroidales bacterium]